MTPETLLNGLGSLSSLIGLGIQIKQLTGKEDKNIIALRAFEAITTVAFRWKHVHNKYHLLLNDVSAINEYCINSKRSDVSIAGISDLIKGLRTIEQKCENFERDVNVYLDDEVRDKVSLNSNANDMIKSIQKVFGNQKAKMAENTFNSQRDAIKGHDTVCRIMQKYSELRSKEINFKTSVLIYDNIKPLYKSFNNVILHTDEILINTIDFYDVIHEFSK